MIKNLTKALVKDSVGQPMLFEKRNGALCKAELGGDGMIGLVNYCVKGQFKQSSLDTYNNDMISLKGDKGLLDVVAVYILNPRYDAGDLATALICEDDGYRVKSMCTRLWKREVVVEVTMADIARLLGADRVIIKYTA